MPAAKLKRWLVHFERIDSLGDGESGLVVVDLTPKLVTLTEKDGQGSAAATGRSAAATLQQPKARYINHMNS